MSKIYDIAFIGSGISSSYTLLHFFNRLKKSEVSKKIQIAMIDSYSEFHMGIPYGSRSGFSVHLITSLKNFLPEPELGTFINWLNANKQWLLKEFESDGGALALDWLSTHSDEIENNKWGDLFIPRSFFGRYICDKVKNNIDQLKKKNILEVDYFVDEAIDIEKLWDKHQIILKRGKVILSEKVILSVGSLPKTFLWRNDPIIEKENLLFINNLYNPSLKVALEKIKDFTSSRKLKKTNVFIVGANASALEIIYKLNDIKDITNSIDKFIFLSSQGTLPDAAIDKEGKKAFVPHNLQSLYQYPNLTAHEIAEATYRDLDSAEEINLQAASTVEKISKAFGGLLAKLNNKELEKFACYYGNEIGRRQRCAGKHYLKSINNLKSENRFEHIAGRFTGLSKSFENEYKVEFLDKSSKINRVHADHANIIINCIGSTDFSKKGIPKLLDNIINKGYGQPNDSKIGFKVNNSLEISNNLHVIGPLLAGNICDNKAVWHAEHCGRIIWLSGLLSEKLEDYFLTEKELEKVIL